MEQYSEPAEAGIERETLEIERLIRWLVTHGHSYQEACECIAFIAGEPTPGETNPV